MANNRFANYKRLAEKMAACQVELEKIYCHYYRGYITAAEQEKLIAIMIRNNVNNETVLSSIFSIIASRPTSSEYKKTISDIFNAELKNHVERIERARMDQELQELVNTLSA